MVTIIIPDGTTTYTNERSGGTSPPLHPSPFLETPSRLPQYVEIRGSFRNHNRQRLSHSSVDRHLTEIFQRVTGLRHEIEYITNEQGSNIPILDTYPACIRYAVGPRCEMLENRFGIGSHIMYLLDNSPLWILLPSQIEHDTWHYGLRDPMCEHPKADEPKKTNLFPKWALEERHMDIQGLGIPPRLYDILMRCEGAIQDYDSMPEDVGMWPIAVCSWYGFSPYIDKRLTRHTLNNHEFSCGSAYRMSEIQNRYVDMGESTDPSWYVLDHMIAYNMNFEHCTCMPECHDMESAEQSINNYAPFLELLEYISYDKQT
jgi:hypothetical protein